MISLPPFSYKSQQFTLEKWPSLFLSFPHNPIISSHKHFSPGFHNNAFSVTNNHHFLIIMLLSLHRNVGLMEVRVIFPIHLCPDAKAAVKCVSLKISLDSPSFSIILKNKAEYSSLLTEIHACQLGSVLLFLFPQKIKCVIWLFNLYSSRQFLYNCRQLCLILVHNYFPMFTFEGM